MEISPGIRLITQIHQHIDFFVEASETIGMGHLARVGAIANHLRARQVTSSIFLAGDASAQEFANDRKIPVQPGRPVGDRNFAVIDAVSLPNEALAEIAGYTVRIVLSPAFRELSYATHYLARSLPINGVLPTGVQSQINSDFSFVTADGSERNQKELGEVSLGVCISGGKSVATVRIAESLLMAHSVKEVFAISREAVPSWLKRLPNFHHTAPVAQPWEFLSNCTVFIGGDGVMVGEAVARGIPTFSLSRDENGSKNQGLAAKGALVQIAWADVESGILAAMLEDRELLNQLRASSNRLNGLAKSENLAEAILEAVKRKSN